ncbi:TetR family transcriptional regulator [Mycobacteroides abscessus subsp. abscessus]|nr:TetR family transcriptional regulator [Mycobacteroides abscessus subsp. abscessus]
MFIAKEIGGDSVDLIELFQLHARAVYAAGARMLEENAS